MPTRLNHSLTTSKGYWRQGWWKARQPWVVKDKVGILTGELEGEEVRGLWYFSLHCSGDRKGIRPVKIWVLVCWWWRFDWSFARRIALVVIPPTSSVFLPKQLVSKTRYALATFHWL